MARTKGQASFMKWVPLLLDALRSFGGSAEAREVCDWIADKVQLPAEEREKRNKHNILRFENQVHWARQYLVWAGLVDSARRGVWTLTPAGAKSRLTEEQGRELVRKVIKARPKKPRAQENSPLAEERAAEPESQLPDDVAEVEPPELAQDNELLEVLQSLSPEGFERLCKRLLHEYGLEKVVVTGKSHDGGID